MDNPAKAEITLGQLLSMSAGLHGEGGNPGIVMGVDRKLDPVARPAGPADQDMDALRTPLWIEPGGGYSYASSSPHIASIVLRNLTGMEMQQYIQEKLAGPMGFSSWGYALHRNGATLPHTPGGGGIAFKLSGQQGWLHRTPLGGSQRTAGYCERLLPGGADRALKDRSGQTAFDFAVTTDPDPRLRAQFLEVRDLLR